MSPPSPYVIVWDLDNTLGDFMPLHAQGECASPITVKVRPGLADALAELSRAGFTHTLLTLATRLYAEMALRATGLRPFFARIDGFGQRGKGDAAGLGQVFGIRPDDLPHRMIFVGDHPIFDEPRDPRVVFHLEPYALTRPAGDLTKLILTLRESGRGSLRHGFDRWLTDRVWWKRVRLLRSLFPSSEPTRASPPGVGRVLLAERHRACPMIGFADVPPSSAAASEHVFVPAELALQVRAELPG